ncbi:MAG: ribonuclease HII [Oscillospiraceae bacterium]|nr:ribonuclease HII [Oscillospiraceae bacterium]
MKKDKEPVDLWELQREYAGKGFQVICGVDEAGRGPLAGPVCAAAVILPDGYEIPGLNDSKQLTDKKRRELFPVIKEQAIAYGIAMVDEGVIDRDNILNATFQAMREAVSQLSVKPDLVLVDGNRLTDFGCAAEAVVKGDARVASIAAASILAKVTRDEYMEQMDALYPAYGFAVHKGYGTKRHYAAIREHGMCPIHRRTFLKKFYGEK